MALEQVATAPDLERRVLEALGDAVVAVGRDGLISAWTGAASRLTGYSAGEAIGRTLAWLLQAPDAETAAELGSLGGARHMEAVASLRRKRRRPLQAAASATRTRNGTVWLFKPMGAWLDPTETAGQAYMDWNQRLGTLVRELVALAGEDLAAVDSSEALAALLVKQGRRLFPGTECLLSVVPHDRHDHFQIVAGAGPWASQLVGETWSWQGTVAGLAMGQRRPIETVTLPERSTLRDTIVAGGIHSARLLPLWSRQPLPDGRHALGALGFYRRARVFFTPYERRLMAEFAQLVSVAIQRTELARITDETLQRLRVGVDVALDLAASLNQREVIRRLVTRAAAATRADRAALLLIEGDEYVVEDAVDATGVSGRGQRYPLASVKADGSPVVKIAVERRRPVLAGSYHAEGMEGAYAQALGSLRRTLLLPLVLSDEVPAVLAVGRREDLSFNPADIATLQLIGNVAVLALRNARLYAQAKEANRLRSEFLNMAAHELRTPLTVIHGYLSMLDEGSFGPTPPPLRRPVETLVQKTQELGQLVEDLLLASRLESGRVPAEVARVDLRTVVSAAVRRARPRAKLVGGRIRARLAGAELPVEADPEHLGRILDNLVNNALTYVRDHEPPAVSVSLTSDGQEAVVRVEDRGRGVTPGAAERIFERFFRLETPGTPRHAGTGLGLYISRELAGRHGGRVLLEWSRPGEGSRFALRLPLAE